MRINPFQAFLPVLDGPLLDESLLGHFKSAYGLLKDSGRFCPTEGPGVYVYEIERDLRVFRGLIACVAVEDYLEGKIKQHEMTLLAKEQVQINLFEENQAIIKPILATYPSKSRIALWFSSLNPNNKPMLEAVIAPEMEKHRLFNITDAGKIAEIQAIFHEELQEVYIADGHHRFAAASRLFLESPEKPFRQVMCAFFDADDLEIHSYNRIVTDMQGLSPLTFLNRLSGCCVVERLSVPEYPKRQYEMLLLLGDGFYSLRWREELLEAYDSGSILLDVQLLNEKILRDILQVADVRKDGRLSYSEGPAGIEAVQKNIADGDAAAFILYPIHFDHLIALSDQGVMLPPKSTWFEPRMKPGLIACSLQESKKGFYAENQC